MEAPNNNVLTVWHIIQIVLDSMAFTFPIHLFVYRFCVAPLISAKVSLFSGSVGVTGAVLWD